MTKQVPIISLQQPEEEAAQAIRAACINFGFFTIKDHGVSKELVDAAMRENERFFAQPMEDKLQLKLNSDFRGYAQFGAEALDYTKKTKGDSKEGMYYGSEYPAGTPGADQPLMGNNQWPAEEALPGHKELMQRYLAAMIALGHRLNRLLALALFLPAEAFDAHFEWPRAGIRLLHYAAVQSDPAAGQYGAGAHTDYGVLTILKTDMSGGLQIQLDGDWVDVQPSEDAFVVNLGDMLERWTNGLFKSTLHRVLTKNRERHSIAFFFDPAFHVVVEVFPQCCTEKSPVKYPPITAGEHLMMKLTTTYASQNVHPLQSEA